jgi:hypothetical protein
MNNKKDEIIFGARRAGEVWLQPFSDYAELDAAPFEAQCGMSSLALNTKQHQI